MRKLLYILLLTTCNISISAQVYNTRIFHPNVRTLRAQTISDMERKQSGEHANPIRPILVLTQDGNNLLDGSDPDNTLDISFDEMSHDVHQYTYTLLHLNADHTVSDLPSTEYISGFTTMDITDIEHSLNTARAYTHYRFSFPNEDMRLTAGGNYALRIYEDGNPDQMVAIVQFCVVEPLVGISGQVRANTDIEFNGRYQQLDIDINTTGLDIRSPQDIQLVVRQNGRTDNQVTIHQPTYVEPNKLRYTHNKDLIFEGGSEYRHMDTYSTYFSGIGVDRILYENGDYHALLNTDDIRTGKPYMHEFDVNGQYIINAERTQYDDTEAEYMWVHWTLPVDQPWFDGALYVGGDLFQNRMTADNRMQYDADNHCYWLSSLVKQGGSDYQYWFVPKSEKKATLQRTEGSHWETQNEYMVYVYYRPFGARADRLVGVQAIR